MKARTSLIYADSGAGKTSQLYFLAIYMWAVHKLKSRLISFDGKYQQFELPNPRLGGKSLIEAGIVEVFDGSVMETALADVRRLSNGYWPQATKNGGRYFKADENCKTHDWASYGAYLIDGMDALSDTWLIHTSEQQMGFKAAWDFHEDEYSWHGSQDGHYGIVQKEIIKVYRQGFHHMIPVKYILSTSKIEKGVENYRRKRVKRNDPNAPAEPNVTTMYGPKAAGQALTPFIPGWFADVFHIGIVETEKGQERGAFYETHKHEDTDIPFLCRVDLLPEQIPALREKFPGGPSGGYIPLGFKRGIDKFYEFVEKGE